MKVSRNLALHDAEDISYQTCASCRIYFRK
jgi:hypothetical protein